MKRILIIILLSFSSILFAQEYNEFGAFNFLGNMPIIDVQTLSPVSITYFNEENNNSLKAIFPYIIAGFIINSTFDSDCWNQSEYIKDYIRNSSIEVNYNK